MKRPWMPIYISDYLKDTTHLGALESGAYFHLIMDYWQNGKLPTDERQLARIAKLTAREWSKLRDTLNAFFYDGWKHKRIEEELAHAVDISNKRSAVATARQEEIRSKEACKDSAIAPANADTLHTSHNTKKEEVRKKETREVALSSASPSDFQRFWAEWPNKVGKPIAEKSFLKALKRAPLAEILAGVGNYIRDKPPDRPWLNPSTFLNQNRWEDQPAQVQNGKTSNVIQATDNLVSILDSFNRGIEVDTICGPESPADVRLLSQG